MAHSPISGVIIIHDETLIVMFYRISKYAKSSAETLQFLHIARRPVYLLLLRTQVK